jgi:anaerobic selenocysteine-containing dehydrogenase
MRNGRAIKIEGDHTSFASEGNCCSKSQASLQACYHPDRVLYPMKRTKPKGENPGWVRITWKEAFDTAGRELKKIRDKYGPHAVKQLHGTSRCYTYSTMMTLKAWGSANHGDTAGQVCKGPRVAVTGMVAFAGAHWMATVDGVKCYVQWGGANETSNYDDSAAVCIDRRWKASSYIVVGPSQQNLGATADMWLALKPGTDGAMAMGWLNVIIKEKLFDEDFVKQWTNAPFLYSYDINPSGFKWEYRQLVGMYPLDIKTRLVKESDLVKGGSTRKFAYYDAKTKAVGYFNAETGEWDKPYNQINVSLSGKYNLTTADGKKITAQPVWDYFWASVKDYTPAKVGAICRVDPKLIENAARTYGRLCKGGGGGINMALAIEHYANATHNIRDIFSIAIITGNIDTPGGMRGGEARQIRDYILPPFVVTGVPDAPPSFYDNVAGAHRFPLLPWIITNGGAAMNHDMTSVTDMILTGKPYPVRGQVAMTGSHFHSANALKNWEAQKALDFSWGSELWFSPTAEMFDIIVPATHWLETKAIRMSQGAHGGTGYQPGPVKPRGEARNDTEIGIQLAQTLNVPYISKEEAAVFSNGNQWPTLDQILNRSVMPMGYKSIEEFNKKFQSEGWQDLKKISPKTFGAYRGYETGALRNDGKKGFPTPTCKAEIMSTIIESYRPNGEQFAFYAEPPQGDMTPAGKELRKLYPLTMINPQRVPVYFHNEHRNLPFTRELYPVPRVKLNPKTANKYGLKEGDWIYIENQKGRITQCVEIFAGTAEDVIAADHQWWYPELPAPDHGCHLSNLNCLVDEYAQDPVTGSTGLRGIPVKIYKAPGAPAGIITSANDPRLQKWLPVKEV